MVANVVLAYPTPPFAPDPTVGKNPEAGVVGVAAARGDRGQGDCGQPHEHQHHTGRARREKRDDGRTHPDDHPDPDCHSGHSPGQWREAAGELEQQLGTVTVSRRFEGCSQLFGLRDAETPQRHHVVGRFAVALPGPELHLHTPSWHDPGRTPVPDRPGKDTPGTECRSASSELTKPRTGDPMRQLLVVLTVTLALVTTACGNVTDTSVGDGPSDTPTPEAEEPLGAGPYPIADLTVTVQLDQDTDATTYRLACLGDTATVTGDVAADAAALCLALDDLPVRDRLVDDVPEDRACTMQFGGPELATLTGTIDGARVDVELDRTNGCGIGDWTLLSPLLPPR
jgi:hypothetical protein